MFGGKLKAVTFSYDDGVTQDIRLIEMLNKYNLKCTFNLNSSLLQKTGEQLKEGKKGTISRICASDVKTIYKDHEIAAHTLTHPVLKNCTPNEILHQVEDDRLRLSELAGYEVVGMAYPGGTNNIDDKVVDVIKNHTGIKYARTTTSTFNFDIQEDLIYFNPTVFPHLEWDELFSLGDKFINLKTDKPQIFYIWGHSYEFDIDNTWDRFEEFCKLISNKQDIFYGTNKEVLLTE